MKGQWQYQVKRASFNYFDGFYRAYRDAAHAGNTLGLFDYFHCVAFVSIDSHRAYGNTGITVDTLLLIECDLQHLFHSLIWARAPVYVFALQSI
jgi:hypothetical protein